MLQEEVKGTERFLHVRNTQLRCCQAGGMEGGWKERMEGGRERERGEGDGGKEGDRKGEREGESKEGEKGRRGRKVGEGRGVGKTGCGIRSSASSSVKAAGPHVLREVMILLSSSQSCLIYHEAWLLTARECGPRRSSTTCALGRINKQSLNWWNRGGPSVGCPSALGALWWCLSALGYWYT